MYLLSMPPAVLCYNVLPNNANSYWASYFDYKHLAVVAFLIPLVYLKHCNGMASTIINYYGSKLLIQPILWNVHYCIINLCIELCLAVVTYVCLGFCYCSGVDFVMEATGQQFGWHSTVQNKYLVKTTVIQG